MTSKYVYNKGYKIQAYFDSYNIKIFPSQVTHRITGINFMSTLCKIS